MSKKTATKTKKPTQKPTKVKLRDTGLPAWRTESDDVAADFLKFATSLLIDIKDRLTALESRLAPAEEWVPKVGDWVKANHAFLSLKSVGLDAYPNVMEARRVDGDFVYVDHETMPWNVKNIRPATSAEIASHKAKEEQRAKEEEWPKVGDYVVLTDPEHPQVGRIDERGEFMDGRYGVTWIDGKSGEEADEMRPATSQEIADHKAKEEQRAKEAEWAKFDVLQEGDACEVTPEQYEELRSLVIGPFKPCYDSVINDITWVQWSPSVTGAPLQLWSRKPDIPRPTVLPFTEFKRRLQGTIAKRAEDERAKEMAAPLEFGMKVRTTQGDGFVHGVYGDGCTHPTGRWWIAFPHNVLNHYARKDITILD